MLSAAAASDPAGKQMMLQTASVHIDLLKLLVRLSKDCRCISNQHYLDMESRLGEAGKMLGGWLNSLKQKNAV